MSTVGSSSTTNPYLIPYSTSDIMAANTTLTAGSSTSSTSNSNSNNGSSGTYSQGLVSQMSGLDVNSMVNQMMASDNVQLNQLLSKQQVTQWTQDRYRSIISNVNTFNGNYFDVLSNNYMLSPNGYSIYNASSTNTSAVTAFVSNQGQAGTYVINSATIAKKAVVTASNTVTTQNSAAFSTLGLSGTLNFTVNGNAVSYDMTANGSKSVSQVMSDLSSLTGATFNYSELTGKFSISSNQTGSAQVLNINTSTAPSPVTNGTTNITSTDSNTDTFLSTLFGISSGTTVSQTGSDGTFNIQEPNGNSNTVTESSNIFTIDGVSYNFTSNITSPTNINVNMDVSSVVNKIQNFVNDYNNLIGGINDVINEKRDYSYQPLTSTQESQMNATQITQWNQKAQQGLLANDDTLNNMLTSMREAFYTPVNGNTLSMASIGLSTSDDPTQGGKLTLNTSTLTSALQSNPQQVISLLTQVSTSDASYSPDLTSSQLSTRNSEEGIFQRLSDIVQENVGTIPDANGNEGMLLQKAGMVNDLSQYNNTLYTELKDEQDAVTQFKLKMNDDKTRYTNQFTQLQTALSQMSTQQSYLSSMFSSSSSG